jgi:Fur family transcriptional regulator, ferric uptake regulator
MARPTESDFQKLLEDKHLRYTSERKYIFDRVARLKEHFDADSLYLRLKKENSRISRATVYRTIPLLLESGVIQKSVGEGKREFFESKPDRHHDHIFCIECHKVIEFYCDEIEKLQDEICERYGFKLAFHDHRLYGHCKDCQARK